MFLNFSDCHSRENLFEVYLKKPVVQNVPGPNQYFTIVLNYKPKNSYYNEKENYKFIVFIHFYKLCRLLIPKAI